MSKLFTQISQEAAQQRSQVTQAVQSPTLSPESESALSAEPSRPETPPVSKPASSKVSQKSAPKTGTVAPQSGTTSSQLDSEKLRLIIQQISQMPTNSNGLNVRMSSQEMQDIEDFVLVTLRREGLKGHDVSIAKLMRYALRYLFRVHEKEFVAALRQALKVEETLSI